MSSCRLGTYRNQTWTQKLPWESKNCDVIKWYLQKRQKKTGALKGRVFLFNNSGMTRWIRRVFLMDGPPLRIAEAMWNHFVFHRNLSPKGAVPGSQILQSMFLTCACAAKGHVSYQISTKTHLYRLALELRLKKDMKILNNFLPTLTKAKWNDT